MRKSSVGFSLIELLVVFMIIAMVMSVVAPSVNKMYRQHMAQQEIRLMQQYVKDISSKAYSQYQDLTILLEDNRLSVMSSSVSSHPEQSNNTDEIESERQELFSENASGPSVLNEPNLFEVSFEYLNFVPASIVASKSGHIQQHSIDVMVGSKGVVKQVAIRGLAFVNAY
ncbi:type II secretion system protein [Alteromonas sp. a30]|uniref:type II secretion system protein n=1 Tax=Alteromonas sp. a30 TaxID=2730917 RepID=UPI0022806B23|nr:type II secretion system protein [Alteromonas sp. a30]MCY7294379.1 type II secretion system protein [Alteromonas sp. a30]